MARFDKLEFGDQPEKPLRNEVDVGRTKDDFDWMRKANENRRTGLYENALRFYSRALESDKTIVAAWVGQVQMLVQLAEYPQADLWARKALELFPQQPELMASRAQARSRLGDQSQALALSDGSMAQPGESAYRWQVRGEILLSQRQSTADHCFGCAELADADWIVPMESALIYLFCRNPSKGVKRAQRAVELEATAWYAWYVLGLTQEASGLCSAATGSYQRCLELCPGHTQALQRFSRLKSSTWSWMHAIRRWVAKT